MLEDKFSQVLLNPAFMAKMANRNLTNQIKEHPWLPHLTGNGLPVLGPAFPVQPLRPLAFLAGGQPPIPPTISPVNHQYLNELIHNREGSPTPTEGNLIFHIAILNFAVVKFIRRSKKLY